MRKTIAIPKLRFRPIAELTEELSAVFLVFSVRFLYPELLQTILKRPECQPEKFCGLGDVIVRLFHRLSDEVALDILEVDSLCGQLERALDRKSTRLNSSH